MGALRRILVALLGLTSLGLTVLLAVALIDHNFSLTLLQSMEAGLRWLDLCFVQGQGLWLPLLLALLSLILGVALLVVAFHRRRLPKQVTVDTLDGGSVRVSLHAIDTVVRRAAGQIPGVSSISDQLRVDKSGLQIHLSFSLPADGNIAELGSSLRREINTQLESVIGVRPAGIEISVVNVSEKLSGGRKQHPASKAEVAAESAPDTPPAEVEVEEG